MHKPTSMLGAIPLPIIESRCNPVPMNHIRFRPNRSEARPSGVESMPATSCGANITCVARSVAQQQQSEYMKAGWAMSPTQTMTLSSTSKSSLSTGRASRMHVKVPFIMFWTKQTRASTQLG